MFLVIMVYGWTSIMQLFQNETTRCSDWCCWNNEFHVQCDIFDNPQQTRDIYAYLRSWEFYLLKIIAGLLFCIALHIYCVCIKCKHLSISLDDGRFAYTLKNLRSFCDAISFWALIWLGYYLYQFLKYL